jgi:hypothetical protein
MLRGMPNRQIAAMAVALCAMSALLSSALGGDDLDRAAQADRGRRLPLKAPPMRPLGWKLYSSLDGDLSFAVATPSDPFLIRSRVETGGDGQSYRSFQFRKGELKLYVMLFRRWGKTTEWDNFDELRSDPNTIAGSVRELDLTGMPGLEFRARRVDGSFFQRVYRSPDGTRCIALTVHNPDAWKPAEIKAFFDSFRLTKKP